MRLPRAVRYLDENLISTHLWDRLSDAILKALFTSLIRFPPSGKDLEIAAYHLYKFMVRLRPGAFPDRLRPFKSSNGSYGPYDCPARPNATKDNGLAAGKKLAAHASNQPVLAKHRIQVYLDALARVY